MLPETTEVLVVGAGPIGLSVAVALGSRGHDVTVVDKQSQGDNTSRAAVVYSRTLEVLEPYGVARELAARGIHASRFTIRDRDRILMSVPFGRLPTRFPYTLLISQAETEDVLLNRLSEMGGRVIRPSTLTELRQDDQHVIATFDDGQEVQADWLVGADGVHSVVREQVGIVSRGSSQPLSFVLADARLSGGAPTNEVAVHFSPKGHLVLAPLPGGICRIVAPVGEAPSKPNERLIQDLIDSRGPVVQPVVVSEMMWSSRFRISHAIADSYRVGRVAIAGDAAHTHSPLGGQGMNLGILDAIALAEALSAAIGGSTSLLDAYATGRRPIANSVISLTERLTRLAVMKGSARRVRNAGIAAAGPLVRKRLARRLSLFSDR